MGFQVSSALPLPRGARIGVIVSGSNVDPKTLADILGET